MLGQDGLGKQVLDKAAELGIASQLNASDALDADVQAEPFNLMHGEVEAIEIHGRGLVLEQDIRMDTLHMQIGKIAIDPLAAAGGNIELKQGTDAEARIVLSEADINQAFQADYLGGMLEDPDMSASGRSLQLEPDAIQFRLPGDGKVEFQTRVALPESDETQPVEIAFTAVPQVSDDGRYVVLKDVCYAEGKDLSPELTAALLDKASQILNLQNFEFDGMSLHLERLEVETGQLTLFAKAYVEKIPSG
jgi:hypothetical protein